MGKFKITKKNFYDMNHKVTIDNFGTSFTKNSDINIRLFMNYLPEILAGNDFREVVDAIIHARMNRAPVIIGMGAHVIKCGLSPLINYLIQQQVITGIAMNGAGAIHDVEIALFGMTSEDVSESLDLNSFGMSKETMEFFSKLTNETKKMDEAYLGREIGRNISYYNHRYKQYSILAKCKYECIPCTIHSAFGTDTIHMDPDFDPREFGRLTHNDFKLFTNMISELNAGVYINIGSAVILPEVFLKALSICRNTGHTPKQFTTVNMDMTTHYRPLNNVLTRPGGHSYNLIGHHEIMVPLLAAAIIDRL